MADSTVANRPYPSGSNSAAQDVADIWRLLEDIAALGRRVRQQGAASTAGETAAPCAAANGDNHEGGGA